MAQRMPCFICPNSFRPQQMSRIHGDENLVKRDIALARRDEANRPAINITPETRICNICNMSISREIQALENDPDCLRLNLLTQTSSKTCLVCNRENDTHRLTRECRAFIFIKNNIYIPPRYVSCNDYLDERSFLKNEFLEQLRYINRPYSLDGNELQVFLQALRESALKTETNKYENELSISDAEFFEICGINKVQFNDLLTYCDPIPIPGGQRYVKKKILFVFMQVTSRCK